MQEALIILILLGALTYLGYRTYKSVTKKKCDDKNCGCG